AVGEIMPPLSSLGAHPLCGSAAQSASTAYCLLPTELTRAPAAGRMAEPAPGCPGPIRRRPRRRRSPRGLSRDARATTPRRQGPEAVSATPPENPQGLGRLGQPSSQQGLGSLAQSARGQHLKQARNILIVIGILTAGANAVMMALVPQQVKQELD